MTALSHLFAQLDNRRSRLGMSKAQLARRSKLSVPTIRRLLSGGENRPHLDTLAALATALGVEIHLAGTAQVHEAIEAAAFRELQARRKATRLARLVQGTMALEAEAVNAEALQEIQEQNVHALLAGPPRRLWGD